MLSRFDWNAIRARQERVAAALAARANDQNRLQRVWARRAEQLATRGVGGTEADSGLNALVAVAGGELQAFEIGDIAGVARLESCVALPGAPDFLLGVYDDGGRMRPLVSLRRLLGLTAAPAPERYVVRLRSGHGNIGLAVEALHDIRQIAVRTHAEASATSNQYVKGATDDHVVLLDTARIRSLPLFEKRGRTQ